MTKYNEYYLTIDEINRIIKASKNLKERIILKVLARTGMRRFELQQLRVADVDFERKRLRIRKGKGGKERIVPIDEDTLQDIKFYLQGRRAGRVIESNNTQKEGISLSEINRIVAKTAEKAKVNNPNPRLKHMNPHIFRHSFARLSLAAGMPFNMVQRIVGHADARTTLQMYGIPSIADVQDIYEQKMLAQFNKPVAEPSRALKDVFDQNDQNERTDRTDQKDKQR